jgi:hypothetical protein
VYRSVQKRETIRCYALRTFVFLALLMPGKANAETPAAPEVKPELLLVTRVGGNGDQWLRRVQVQGNRVVALGEQDFSVQVVVADDNTVKGTITGNIHAEHKNVNRGINHVKSAKMGPLTYGYKQVAPLLQQPYMNGPGWSLWGWTEEQCKKAKGTYAPFMADSGISHVQMSPHNTYFAASYCDGGNTSLRVDPRNIDKDLSFSISHGGGGGKSAFCFEIDPTGKLLRQMVFRGWVNCVCWDEFQRPIMAGAAVLKAGQAPDKFGSNDGAGIAMADAEWSKLIFGTHIGNGESESKDKSEHVFWSVAIDSKTGICAVAGYVRGELKQHNALQNQAGTGTDGLLAIFRLWTPETYNTIKGTATKRKVLPF